MEELKAKVDVLSSDVVGIRKDVGDLRDEIHRLDKDQAVMSNSFNSMAQMVATLTTSVATLAVTINKQQGAVGMIKSAWALVGAALLWVAEHWKNFSQLRGALFL